MAIPRYGPSVGAFYVIYDPVHPVGMGMIPIVAQFVPKRSAGSACSRQTDREPHDVDERVGGIPEQVAEGYGEAVLEHCISHVGIKRSVL